MKKETILEFIKATKKGTFQKMISETQITEDLVKRVESVIRVGIDNKNRADNKNKVTGDLPWGEFTLEYYIIEHTNKNGEHNVYLRYYTTKHRPKVKYFYQGQEVTKQYLIDNKIISESKLKSNDSSVRNINIKNIIRLGNFA